MKRERIKSESLNNNLFFLLFPSKKCSAPLSLFTFLLDNPLIPLNKVSKRRVV